MPKKMTGGRKKFCSGCDYRRGSCKCWNEITKFKAENSDYGDKIIIQTKMIFQICGERDRLKAELQRIRVCPICQKPATTSPSGGLAPVMLFACEECVREMNEREDHLRAENKDRKDIIAVLEADKRYRTSHIEELEIKLKKKEEQIEVMSIPSDVITEIHSCDLYGTGCHKDDCVFRDRCMLLFKKEKDAPQSKETQRDDKCPRCMGDGWILDSNFERTQCRICHGTGKKPMSNTCPDCKMLMIQDHNGTLWTCPHCGERKPSENSSPDKEK